MTPVKTAFAHECMVNFCGFFPCNTYCIVWELVSYTDPSKAAHFVLQNPCFFAQKDDDYRRPDDFGRRRLAVDPKKSSREIHLSKLHRKLYEKRDTWSSTENQHGTWNHPLGNGKSSFGFKMFFSGVYLWYILHFFLQINWWQVQIFTFWTHRRYMIPPKLRRVNT